MLNGQKVVGMIPGETMEEIAETVVVIETVMIS